MKILVSAFACNPYLPTENFGGWAAVRCLARDHDVWVLTGGRNRADLARAEAEGLVPGNVHFIHAGRFQEWHPNRMRARLQSWSEYLSFSGTILEIARDLHREINFDLAHHVSFATWRVASPLWKLGIPFILGPVGGNENFPLRFLPILSPAAVGFELFRKISTGASHLSPSVRACLRRASHIFAANSETEHLVQRLRGSRSGISRLMQTFYSEEELQGFTCYTNLKRLTGPLRMFAGGNLEGRKGIALAFHALARVKAKGVSFRYWVGKHGPEFSHLEQLAHQLGLQTEITFGFLPSEDYRKELGATHILLLPSLRDSVGITLMEAMLAGCVPIVADCGGPAHLVNADCGYKIPVSNPRRVIEELANAILAVDRDRDIISKKGAAGAKRIAAEFTEENYRTTISDVYRSAIQRSGK